MTHTTRWPRLALLLVALALVATGCRGDEGAEVGLEEVETPGDAPAATDDEEATDETDPGTDAATGPGVTEEPCPAGINPDNGCIYLGTISDLSVGPFVGLAVPLTASQVAFWERVNNDGGLGGYDIDVEEFTRDNLYDPEIHSQEYAAIEPDILALAQTLGSPTTAAIVEQLETDMVIGAPASWTSAWDFSDPILESGTNYCFEGMNQVDYAVENQGELASVMAVGYPGDYGGDAAAGVEAAAEFNELEFTNVETALGVDNQSGAISQIVQGAPDLVVITTGPADTGAIIGQAVAGGYAGRFSLTGPSWNLGLLGSPAGDAILATTLISGYWPPFDSDTPGHTAMREAVGEVEPNEGYTVGWVWQYPLLAVLEIAAEAGDLTREGLLAAVESLETVDYEGMLPEEAGDFSGEPGDNVFRQSVMFEPNPEAPTGATLIEDFFSGPTAEGYDFTGPCFTTQ